MALNRRQDNNRQKREKQMLWIVVLGLIGLAIGVDAGHGGWLFGLMIGALAGLCIKLSQRISALEVSVRELRVLRVGPPPVVANESVNDVAREPKQNVRTTQATPLAVREVSTHQSITDRPVSDKPIADYPITDRPTTEASTPRPESAPTATSAPSFDTAPRRTAEHSKTTPATAPWSQNEYSTSRTQQTSAAARKDSSDTADRLLNFVVSFFTQGNPVVRIGVVVLFFGVSFLLKYAAEHSMFPIELRLMGVAGAAIALIAVGWKLRTREGQYGLVLQGGGVGLLYTVIFAAAKFYTLFPLTGAFAVMFLVVILGSLIAVLQNALPLALLATAGGFLAPVLTSSGDGSHIALFSYYLLLNTGILFIAWFKAWRLLNLSSFIFTFVIATAWGVLRYEEANYLSSQGFLIAFSLQFLAISLLFALRQPPQLKGLIDGSLVFGLPLLAFGLQSALVGDWEYALAISSLALAAVYILLAAFVLKRAGDALSLLGYSYLCIGGMFATIAIPLALDAQWTSATWALEGVGLLWVGIQQKKTLPRIAAYVLQFAAVISLLADGGLQAGTVPLIQGDYLGLVLVSLSAIVIAWILDHSKAGITDNEHVLSGAWLGAGLILFGVAHINEIGAHLIREWRGPSVILFTSTVMLLLLLLQRTLPWPRLRYAGYALLPIVLATSINFLAQSGQHPFSLIGGVAYLLFYVTHYLLLKRNQRDWPQLLQGAYHAIGGLLLLTLVFREAQFQLPRLPTSAVLHHAFWLIIYVTPVMLSMRLYSLKRWPFADFPMAYRNIVPAYPLLLSLTWFIAAAFRSGVMPGVPFFPLFNLTDLGQVGVLLLLMYTNRHALCALDKVSLDIRIGVIAVMGFVTLNTILLRALHYYLDITYTMHALWHSMTVQMALSILWTLLALVTMYLAKHWQSRKVWVVGAGLLAMVLLKLFLKELADSGTLTRIVSFLVVGALMLLIGYLSPLPPRASAPEKAAQEKTA